MRVILFTGDSPPKILDGTKTMTARFWRKTPPRLSEVVRAQTGRRKETTFAYLKVVGLAVWNPFYDPSRAIEERLGLSLSEIAEKEGFRTWDEFMETYLSLNSHHDPNDPKRKHYFIEFEMVDMVESQPLGQEMKKVMDDARKELELL